MNTIGQRFQVVMWNDIFTLVDDGSGTVTDYKALEAMVHEQYRRHPDGVGCLCILPKNASPPPTEVRKEINAAMDRMAPMLRAYCWIVEGTGFRAAAVRGVLTGLLMFSRKPYPVHVAVDLRGALHWMLPLLANGPFRSPQLTGAMAAIELERCGHDMAISA